MMDNCEKHGPYFAFCRECDGDFDEIHYLERVDTDLPVLELERLPPDGTPRKPGKRRMLRPR